MNRPVLVFIAALFIALAPFACTASLEEDCLTGPCAFTDASAASSAGSGGAGGSGGAAECPPNPATGEYPCDVFNVLQTRCFECHTDPPVGGAPFSLRTYEDSQQPLGMALRWNFMKADIESGFMPFGKPDDLQGAELKTMQDWFAQCAPPAPAGMGCE